MKSIAAEKDMRLMKSRFPSVSPASLPVSFNYGGKYIKGIDEAFHPAVQTEKKNENLLIHTVLGKNADGLEIRVEILEYLDYPVMEFLAFFTNTASSPTPILSDIKIFDGFLSCPSPVLVHGNGDTLNEEGYEWIRENADHEIIKHPKDGTSCNGAFPYMRLESSDTGINIAVGWPAVWRAEFAPAEGGVSVKIGQNRIHTRLLSGETLQTPRATFMFYTGDEARGTNLWRRWYFEHILPRPNGKPLSPKCCMHVFEAGGHPEFTGADEANQLGGIDDYLKGGIRPDVWWLDAGWYPCNYNWPEIGTWEPDSARFPNGLAPIGKKCKENGMDFLLWFEPERVRPGTRLAIEHPEWLLHAKKPDGSEYENMLLNLGNRECLKSITELVINIIKASGVTVYRQDFNFDPAPFWLQNEKEDRAGALENFHVQGYLAYWDTLLKENPGLWIDSCASGGRRNDLETMRRAVPLHYTDVGYGHHPIKQKQHYLMFMWIPYFRAHNMNWADPETGEYGKAVFPPDRYSYYCAMTPALTDLLEHDADESAYALAREMQPIWRKAADIMLNADYYPLTECRKSAEDFYAVQFHSPDTDSGFIEIIRNTQTPHGTFTAKFKNLDKDKSYLLTCAESGESLSFTGEALMNGVSFALPRRSGKIYFYGKVGCAL